MLSGLWVKISAAMGVALGFLLMLLKIKNNTIDNLEAENEVLEIKDRISDDMDLATRAARAEEAKRNEKRAKKPIDPDDQFSDL